jgi:hypothetical protein
MDAKRRFRFSRIGNKKLLEVGSSHPQILTEGT